MTTGLGVDPILDGNGIPTAGTSAADIRKIYGGLFSPGVISGCNVTPSATGLTYSVSSGVVAIQISTGEIVLAPVPAGTVQSAVGASGGLDIIYAKQNLSSTDGSVEVVLGVSRGNPIPPRSVALRGQTLPAGASNTNAGILTASIDYSIPYGASLGPLVDRRYTGNGVITLTSPTNLITASFSIPTDRRLRITLNTCMSSVKNTSGTIRAVGFDNSAYTEVNFDVVVDGTKQWGWNTPGLHQAWANYCWTDFIQLNKGTHTIALNANKLAGSAGIPFFRYSGGDYRGTLLTVEDIGPMV